MRHDFLPARSLPPAPRPPGVREASGPAGLVAPPGRANAFAPRRSRAAGSAVALSAVAAAADQYLLAATRADKYAGAARRLALPCSMHTRLASQRARVPTGPQGPGRSLAPAAILRTHSRSTRVGRGGSNNLPVVASVAPVLLHASSIASASAGAACPTWGAG